MDTDTPQGERRDDPVPPSRPVLPEHLADDTIDGDSHAETDIARYVANQTRDETVLHVERIKEEVVLGQMYEIWDVTTDKDRWWVITNLTSLYSQHRFPSLDFTLTFHIGLMMRLRNRSDRADAADPSPFDEVFRREDQAERRHDTAIEAEDYQAVGMLLRESLISLVTALRRRAAIPADSELPRDSDFLGWTDILMNQLCGGGGNKEMRHNLKNTAREAWQLVNWL